MEFARGEVVEWVIEDKAQLVLRLPHDAAPVRAQKKHPRVCSPVSIGSLPKVKGRLGEGEGEGGGCFGGTMGSLFADSQHVSGGDGLLLASVAVMLLARRRRQFRQAANRFW